ncbi:MAG: V4R domain-containing protein [Candidatus Bathyarchaeia archaeon]
MEPYLKQIKARSRQIRRFGAGWVLLRVEALQGMFVEVNKVLGTGSSLVWYIAGKGAGRSMAKFFQTHMKEGESLKAFFNEFAHSFNRWGWGRIEKAFLGEETGEFIIRIYNNAFTEVRQSRVPSCYFLKGYFEGLIEMLTGGHISSQETRCTAKGDPYCEFQITLE